jgi:threonine dehydrogenase-like Zn-dependent dehydrogenase
MPKAVRFDRYGNVDVLEIAEVEIPALNPGQVLVRTIVAGTNPGDIPIREGLLAQEFPTTFPSGQGTDFAGVVAELGDGVTIPSIGTPVIGPCRPTRHQTRSPRLGCGRWSLRRCLDSNRRRRRRCPSTRRNYLVVRCRWRGRFASCSVGGADWSHCHRHCWKVAS